MNSEPVAAGTLVIIAAAGYCSYLGLRRPGFMDRYLFSPRDVLAKKEYRRLVTSAFLHADWMHFGVNAFSLYMFGSHVERACGLPILAAIFFASVVGGNLLALWLHRHHAYRAMGASGGVCGVIFASIFLLPGGSVRLLLLPIPIPAYIYAILFLLVSVYGVRAARDNVGHDAHLGGAIVGLLVTTALRPSIVGQSPLTYALVLAISAGAFLFVLKDPWGIAGSAGSPLERVRRAFRDAKRRAEARARREQDEAVDCILEKIAKEGMESLSESERQILKGASDQRRRR